MEICPKCGLPKQACVCEQIVKSSQKIQVTTERKKYGKVVTVVSGFDSGIDIKKTAKALKNELACGGTYKGNAIELQGDHTKKVKSLLVRLGFDEESISD
ncbi:stress response translation initiation inhibitor YciH [Candidatus Pacearchaeota archaeon]|nr:stress response translation initiation inhibitor YciH [Candidatus Pacearchaeota archaeon]